MSKDDSLAQTQYSTANDDRLFRLLASLCYDTHRYPMTGCQPQQRPGVSHLL
jgi:hypothetical protein